MIRRLHENILRAPLLNKGGLYLRFSNLTLFYRVLNTILVIGSLRITSIYTGRVTTDCTHTLQHLAQYGVKWRRGHEPSVSIK